MLIVLLYISYRIICRQSDVLRHLSSLTCSRLCLDQNTSFSIPEEVNRGHPQASLLGAPLEAADELYTDLLNTKFYIIK